MTFDSASNAMPVNSTPPAAQVREELSRILDSPDFKSTSRRRKMIKYLVEELLAGRDKGFKGYTIATVVFGRNDSFDPQTDPIVRLEARRLRHDLNSYYVSAGRDSQLRITIPKGQYMPVMEWSHSSTAAPVEVDEEVVANSTDTAGSGLPLASAKRPFGRRLAVTMTLLGLAAVLVIGLILKRERLEAYGPSLAVLPFTTYNATPSQVGIGQGIADEVLTRLSRFPGIRLYLPGATTEKAADAVEVGSRLGLTYVLDGTVQAGRGSDTMRISARLVEVKTRRIIWIGNYERTYTIGSFPAVQDDIANSVVSALGQPGLAPRSPPMHSIMTLPRH